MCLPAIMADGKMASAATALEPKRKRRRAAPPPPWTNPEATDADFSGPWFPIGPAMDALRNIASEPPKGPWDWEATRYIVKDRSRFWKQAPPLEPMTILNNHSQVLLALFRLKPNGHINIDALTFVLIRLHNAFGIFPRNRPPSRIPRGHYHGRAQVAAYNWSFMCFECITLIKRKVEIPKCFNGLKDVLAAIQIPGLTDVVAKPVAATVPVNEDLPAFDDTTPHCSMALTG